MKKKALIILIVAMGAVAMIGCPKSRSTREHEARMAQLESIGVRIKQLKNEESELLQEQENLQRANEWLDDRGKEIDVDYEEYKLEKKAFLEGMTNEQLEIYSSYNDAVKGQNDAKQELYSRKLVDSLNASQKKQLLALSEKGESLVEREKKLKSKREALLERGERNIARLNDVDRQLDKIGAFLGQQRMAAEMRMASQPSTLKTFSDGMDKMRRDMKQQQRDDTMESMDRSLSDISRSLKGY